MRNIYQEALNQMCSNCKNHDMCQSTGCEPKKDIMDLVELATPKKPYYVGEDCEGYYDTWTCPNCGMDYEVDYDKYDFCPKCGQHLNLKIEEENKFGEPGNEES